MDTKQLKGSKTAKDGFLNEKYVVDKFNNWLFDEDAKLWLKIMNYNLLDIEYVIATIVTGKKFKTDIQVQIRIKLKNISDVQNIQVKLVSNKKGFNQIDKRWVDNYVNLWNIPTEISFILKLYCGEISPIIDNPKDIRRMNCNEFTQIQQNNLLQWISNNKFLIVADIMKGRGELAAEWILVINKYENNIRWCLKSMNECMSFFSNGDISITSRGVIKIGKITMQRKGGDGGRNSSKMLQFKINPIELFDI